MADKLSKTILCVMCAIVCLIYQSCLAQPEDGSEKSELIDLHPQTIAQETLTMQCHKDASVLRRHIEPSKLIGALYYDGDTLFDGWACETFLDTDHRFRYTKYEKGKLVRQIGYFDNGQVDHDFSMMHGASFGSERMWCRDGKPYVLNYYIRPGIKHDYQRRWDGEGQLIFEAFFEEGKEIYSVELDGRGNVIKGLGEVPEKWAN